MLRIATVGTSAITEKFLEANRFSGAFEHTLVYSRNQSTAREFAQKVGCKSICCDLKAVARRSDFDAVYIASPNAFHYEQSRLFLKNGKHVLCEKPITTSVREYKALRKLARKKGLIYMEAMMSVNSCARSSLNEALKKCGRIKNAVIDFSKRSSRLDRFLSGEHCNIFDMSLKAGALMDIGVYCVYAAVDMFGMPRRITAKAELLPNDADCCGEAMFYYDGFDCRLIYSKTADSTEPSRVSGEKGEILIGSVSQYKNISFSDGCGSNVVFGSAQRKEVMAGEAKRFSAFIKGEDMKEYERLSCLALDVRRCMDKIKKSARLKYPAIRQARR